MQRNTPQREAILATLRKAPRPLSAEEILREARRRVPGIGLATVYRHLSNLVADERLRAVELPGGGRRYEGATAGHRHHFRCRACDRLFAVDGCPGGIDKLAPRGFLVEEHDILLTGLCAACRGPRR